MGTGAVILLGASVKDSVEGSIGDSFECPFGRSDENLVEGILEGPVSGSFEGPFVTSVGESVGGCSVEASVELEFIVLVLPVELVGGMLVISVQLL